MYTYIYIYRYDRLAANDKATVPPYVTYIGAIFILSPIMEDQMESNMEHEMETGGGGGRYIG